MACSAMLLAAQCVSIVATPRRWADDGEGGLIGTVDISTTKVAEKGGRKKGVAGGHTGMEPMEVDAVAGGDAAAAAED